MQSLSRRGHCWQFIRSMRANCDQKMREIWEIADSYSKFRIDRQQRKYDIRRTAGLKDWTLDGCCHRTCENLHTCCTRSSSVPSWYSTHQCGILWHFFGMGNESSEFEVASIWSGAANAFELTWRTRGKLSISYGNIFSYANVHFAHGHHLSFELYVKFPNEMALHYRKTSFIVCQNIRQAFDSSYRCHRHNSSR